MRKFTLEAEQLADQRGAIFGSEGSDLNFPDPIKLKKLLEQLGLDWSLGEEVVTDSQDDETAEGVLVLAGQEMEDKEQGIEPPMHIVEPKDKGTVAGLAAKNAFNDRVAFDRTLESGALVPLSFVFFPARSEEIGDPFGFLCR